MKKTRPMLGTEGKVQEQMRKNEVEVGTKTTSEKIQAGLLFPEPS